MFNIIKKRKAPKIGLALGGGGVRGLAHIPVLEVLDEYGIRPSIIAGTSMGAIIGALYASGLSGREIRERVSRPLVRKVDTWRDLMAKKNDVLKLLSALAVEFPRGGLISTRGFIAYFFNEIKTKTFEELSIPLLVTATDYWNAEEIVFEKGKLFSALQASMAVPGVFAPVQTGGRVLVDGGIVNLVPYDLLLKRVDFTIAVDVSGTHDRGRKEIPSAFESVLKAFNIMQTAALAEKMKHWKPDLYVRPDIRGVRIFDFGKADEVFHQAGPAVEGMRKQLQEMGFFPMSTPRVERPG